MQDLPEGIKVRVPFFLEREKQETRKGKNKQKYPPPKKEVFKNIS